ncbi:hypothetical protein [Aureispira sp. CCB-E]|uniref:hypothetical protein n=1 Tax=Aureispira sp. CCB-E TaxID=3051121 RepID=UPI00286960C5|nr:hypothetical protein [Aureispira sp. CCB-E]WMX12262.1 hypothetical protein QP953_15650 [Aureispira sp. CCB-E]
MKIKLSGITRFFISSPNANIVTGIELNTLVTKEQLSQALIPILEQQPVLQMVPTVDQKNDVYLVFKPTATPIIKVYEDVSYTTLAQENLQTVHRLNENVLIHFVLNQHRGYSDLIVVANHAICDGISLNHILHDLIAVLNGDALAPLRPVGILKELIPETTAPKSLDWAMSLVNRLLGKKDFLLTQDMIDTMYANYWENRKTSLWIEELTEEETTKLVQHCKQNAYSVNTFLATLFLYTRADLPKKYPSVYNYIVTVNLRKKLKVDPGHNMGLYVSSMKFDLPKNTQIPFKAFAGGLQQKISQWFDSPDLFGVINMEGISPSFIDIANLNKYNIRNDWFIQKLIKKLDLTRINTAFILTNYGRLNSDQTKKYHVKHYLPVVVSSAMTIEHYISVYTYNNKMRIGLCYDGHVSSKKEVDAYVKTFKKLLKKHIL